jgi:hypothetical protein
MPTTTAISKSKDMLLGEGVSIVAGVAMEESCHAVDGAGDGELARDTIES